MPLNFPNTPANGDLWTDPSNNVEYIYTLPTNHWRVNGDLGSGGGGGGGGGVDIGVTPPLLPQEGDMWYNPNNGLLYVYESGDWRTSGGTDVSVTSPPNPITGDFWFDTSDSSFYVYTGAQWEPVSSSGGGGGEIGITPPTNPSPGDLWFNNVNGILYIWYEDPDGGTFWVDVRPAAEGGSGSQGLTSVATDSPLSGDGTVGDPVDLVISALPPAP